MRVIQTGQRAQVSAHAIGLGLVLPNAVATRCGVRATGDTVRVVLLDGQHWVRAALNALLSQHERIQRVGDAAGVHEAAEMATRNSAQVIPVNASLQDDDPLRAIRMLAQLEHAPLVIALGNAAEPQRIHRANGGRCGERGAPPSISHFSPHRPTLWIGCQGNPHRLPVLQDQDCGV